MSTSTHTAGILSFNDGHLGIKATDGTTTEEQASALLQEATATNDCHSVLLYDYAEAGEPYYGSAAPWVEALGNLESQKIERIIIDTPYQPQNRQSSILLGDLSSVLAAHQNLKELIVSGYFELTDFSHPTLEKAEFTKQGWSIDDVTTIAAHDCPNLERLGINVSEDEVPDEFSEILVNTLSSNNHFNLDELYVFHSDQGQELIRRLCDTHLIDKLTLIDLLDQEFGYDPDESMELLLSNASKLTRLNTLRIPYSGLMEDEITQLTTAIPCMVNSCPVHGEPMNVPWYRPFSPQHYGSDKFSII